MNGGIIGSVGSHRPGKEVVPNLTSWSDIAHREVWLTGDSIGAGTAATDPSTQAWFILFCQQFGLIPKNLSISGQQLVNDGVNPIFDPNTIPLKEYIIGAYIMALGLNDFDRAQSVVTYQANLTTAIQKAIDNGLSPNRIMIISPYWRDPSNTGQQPYQDACLAVAQNLHTMHIAMRDAIASACTPSTGYISGDGIHPTTAGHLVIKNIVASASLTPL